MPKKDWMFMTERAYKGLPRVSSGEMAISRKSVKRPFRKIDLFSTNSLKLQRNSIFLTYFSGYIFLAPLV